MIAIEIEMCVYREIWLCIDRDEFRQAELNTDSYREVLTGMDRHRQLQTGRGRNGLIETHRVSTVNRDKYREL